ncbi:unnamed protein product [Rodentolepis nana]|uniref:ZM domain-containing protein n=1 Tax=Rodentolepis nana TaxID=102285 RepID=A0A0R3TTH4_RODNA|nr:unnamed protein product [Rodentolepis nana]
MNTPQFDYTRRRDVIYPDPLRNCSSRPPNHYRATSVDPYRASDNKHRYNSSYYQNYELISPVSNSRDCFSRPPIPQSQPTHYRNIHSTKPCYSSTPSTSANRYRISGNLPRSSSTSRLIYSDYPTHNPTTSYQSHTDRGTYGNGSKCVYTPTSLSSSCRREALTTTKRLDSQLSGSFTRLSTRSPPIYNRATSSGVYALASTSAEIRPRKPRHQEIEEVSKDEAYIKPMPKPRSRGLDSPDSANLNSPDHPGYGSYSKLDGNVNNMYSLRTSTSSTSSAGEYSATSPGPRLHGGHSGFNSTLPSSNRSNNSGNAGLIGLMNLGNTVSLT